MSIPKTKVEWLFVFALLTYRIAERWDDSEYFQYFVYKILHLIPY